MIDSDTLKHQRHCHSIDRSSFLVTVYRQV